MKVYNKLVRDKIPDIIESENKKAHISIIPLDQFEQYLNNKLQEELDEYIKSGDVMELVDIGEVMHSILELKNVSIQEYQRLRKEKLESKGGFKERILLKSVE